MLYKTSLFGVGLWLGSTVAIFASVSSDVIATEKTLHDFRNELNQICWQVSCSSLENKISYQAFLNDGDLKKKGWIVDNKYQNSRRKVIGKAIADCVTGDNEFAGKTARNIITFDEKAYPNKYISPKNYDKKHWNAVILYNYIHEAINGTHLPEDSKNYVDEVQDVKYVLRNKWEDIHKHYEKYCGEDKKKLAKLEKSLHKAVKDIQQYVSILELNIDLCEFRISKLKYDKTQNMKDICPDVKSLSDDNCNLMLNCPFLAQVFEKNNTRFSRIQYEPAFTCFDGSLYISGLRISVLYAEKDEQCQGKVNVIYAGSIVPDTYVNFNNFGIWLLYRLKGLAEAPMEELWNWWYR